MRSLYVVIEIFLKYAIYDETEDFQKALKLSKVDFDEINGTNIEVGDLVRVG